MTASTRWLLPAAWRLVAVAAVFAAALLAVVLLVSSDDPALTGEPAIAPLRVTSGSEIATGFAVGSDRVVTVAHLLDGAVREGGADAAVRVRGMGARVLRARVLSIDRRSDLALLAVRGLTGGSPQVAAGAGDELRGLAGGSPQVAAAGAGDEVRILRLRDGRSSSLVVRVRRAIVAHVRAAGAGRELTRPALELAAQVRAGDSGAPVVSSSGALAGVVFATSTRRGNMAYAVDASAVARLLARD